MCLTLLGSAHASCSPPKQHGPVSLSSSSSDEALSSSSSDEALSARPQLVFSQGKVWKVHSHQWGVTIAQCKELMRRCCSDPNWDSKNNVYTLVTDYIVPMTAGTGLGYALLLNHAHPKEVTIMVSHAWSENAEEFFKTLERSVSEDDVMFICFLALYQCEDAMGPSRIEQIGVKPEESPFRRVLDHIAGRRRASWLARTSHVWGWLSWILLLCAASAFFAVVGLEQCIPVLRGQCAVGGLVDYNPSNYHGWYCMLPRLDFTLQAVTERGECLVRASFICSCSGLVAWLLAVKAYRGHMLVVPNRECDLYTRLWCVYEVHTAGLLGVPCLLARTLASAGRVHCQEATCSCEQDQERITLEIEKSGGFELVDSAVRRTMRSAQRRFLHSMLFHVPPYLTMSLAVPGGDWAPRKQLWGTILCTGIFSSLLASVLVHLWAYTLVKRQAGKVAYRDACGWTGLLLVLGLAARSVDEFYFNVHGPFLRQSGPMDFPPFHHCFTFSVISGSLSMVLMICLEWLCRGRFIQWPHRCVALPLVLLLSVSLFTLYATAVPSAVHYYASAIWFIAFRLSSYTGFFALLWTTAARWGVQLVHA
mmetsp:Transcript_85690/g.227679  ORF Transcript_85690/g.227679 Transcript_85690/m.227679 type:complete len:592 (-) Transcript_85690:449-2224(-)